jgi:hypothetical protein
MKSQKILKSVKRFCSKCSSLILLFQRSPLIQMLLPEANVLGTSGVMNTVSLTIATVAGLGAYDTVAGATLVSQVSPSSGSATIPASSGVQLNGVFQIVGAGGHTPGSWQISTGTLPTGLTLVNRASKSTTLSGIPTQTGNFPITIKAWENSGFSGRFASGSFTITIAPPPVAGIVSHPASSSIASGSTTTLSVTASGSAPFTYRWYQGTSGNTSTAVGTNSPTFTTPALIADTSYWVKVTNSLTPAGVNSNTANISIVQPAVIDVQPQSTATSSGGTATLSVTASGTAPFTYQWYQGISGVTTTPVGTNSATFITPKLATLTSYWVKVTNTGRPQGVLSSTATVAILLPAAITTGPAASSVGTGTSATMSVVASGTQPITYQWYEGASGIITKPVGTNSPSFTSDPLTANTSFWVKVTNRVNNVGAISKAAAVSVIQPASIVTQPQSVTILSGKSAKLLVAGGGTAKLAYQWYQGLSGDTSKPVSAKASFSTPKLTANTSYWVKVTNAANLAGAFSQTAFVTVNVPAAIATQPVTTSSVSLGGTVSLHVVAKGTAPFTYQWYQGKAGTTTIPVGTNSPDYTSGALTANTSYWVKITNAVNTKGVNSITSVVTVTNGAAILTPPASIAIDENSTTTLSVIAGGLAPFTYQWYQGLAGNSTTPVGTNSASFTTPSLIAETSYWVKVTNATNTIGANSTNATVTINPPPPPAALRMQNGVVAGVAPYEAWKQYYFDDTAMANAEISGNAADSDGDGMSNENEYIFGTDPLQNEAAPMLNVAIEENQITLSFPTRQAAGIGYEGMTRHYAIESSRTLVNDQWQVLPGVTDIAGNGQAFSTNISRTEDRAFFRIKSWLTP